MNITIPVKLKMGGSASIIRADGTVKKTFDFSKTGTLLVDPAVAKEVSGVRDPLDEAREGDSQGEGQ
jgi:hypothetical protein